MKSKIFNLFSDCTAVIIFIIWIIHAIFIFSKSGVVMPSYTIGTGHFIIGLIYSGFGLYGVYNFIKNFREYL